MANQNVTQLVQQTGSAAATSLFYAVTTGSQDTGLPLSVLVNNLGLTGIPTAPTASGGTNTTQIASTAFVQTTAGAYAPLAGATFTGTVTVSYVNANLSINDSTAANEAQVSLQSSGVTRWELANLSSSSNAFSLGRYVAGTFTDSPITISNSTGAVTMVDGIVGSPIGASSPSTGAFTTLTASSGMNNTAVGATAPSTGAFTTLSSTGNFTPSQTNGIVGTNTNNNANAGSVGEFVTASATAVSMTSGTPANVTSISLTAGDWDVVGNMFFLPAATTVIGLVIGCINTTTGTIQAGSTGFTSQFSTAGAANVAASCPAPKQRISLSATTTVFLVGQVNFTISTCTASGNIQARRVR